MPAVAMTDRDGLYGAARFVAACAKEGVAPILGASLTVRTPTPPGGRGRRGSRGDTSVVLLAIDDAGYANLCRLITDAHMLGSAATPGSPPSRSARTPAGWLALLGPRSQAGRIATAGRVDAAARAVAPLREAFGADRLFVAVEHRVESRSGEEVRAMLRLAERLAVAAVATNPVRYLVPQDAFLADALECMRRIVPVASNNVTRANAEGWLKPAREMRALFAERPDLCDATLRDRRAVHVRPGPGARALPGLPDAGGAQRRRRARRAVLARRP